MDDREKGLNVRATRLSGLASAYDEVVAEHDVLRKAYRSEKSRRIRLEAEYEYDSNNVEHVEYRKAKLQQNKKRLKSRDNRRKITDMASRSSYKPYMGFLCRLRVNIPARV